MMYLRYDAPRVFLNDEEDPRISIWLTEGGVALLRFEGAEGVWDYLPTDRMLPEAAVGAAARAVWGWAQGLSDEQEEERAAATRFLRQWEEGPQVGDSPEEVGS
jgi:hypothetical protein